MKRAIYTIMIGNDPTYRYARHAFADYATRVGAELIVRTKLQLSRPEGLIYNMARAAKIQKLFMKELLAEYDRVLYLDADILVAPHAPDIFETYADPEVVYMFDEGGYADRTVEIDAVSRLLGLEGDWPRHDGRPVYYNSGVILCSRGCPLFDLFQLEEVGMIDESLRLVDQTYINYLVNRHGLEAQSLDPRFNRMEILGDDERRLEAYFIHYAGSGYARRKKFRYRTFIDDYRSLYGGSGSVVDAMRLRLDVLRHELWRFKNETLRDSARRRAGRELSGT
ncbi:MAG: glycosyltransferase [Alphaproteobacteria bacterium]|jgi:lipopolysaccharide biosynthesis glycosyltransferase|nr:glycosyltransferase [Alphaproteobacteria bacterium]